MKKIQFILTLFCVLALLPACNDDEQGRLTALPSVISDLESTDYTLPKFVEGQNPYLFRMTWTKAKYFSESESPVYVGDVVYEVEVDLAGNEFENPRMIFSTQGLYMDVYEGTLRTILSELAGENKEESQVVGIRIKTTGSGLVVYSEPILLSITPYVPEPSVEAVSGVIAELTEDNYQLQRPTGEDNPQLFTIGWTATGFYLEGTGTPAPVPPAVEYTLQIDQADNNFASPQTLAVTSLISVNILTREFNNLLIEQLGATPGESMDLQIRLLSRYNEGGVAKEVLSNSISLSATPYVEVDPVRPIYMVGDMNNWNTTNTDFMMFKENSDVRNYVYTFTGYFDGNVSFKIIPEESLGTNKAYCRKEEGTLTYADTQEGKIWIATAGYKTITVNLEEMTYTIVDYDASGATEWEAMSVVGAYCGWNPSNSIAQMSKMNGNPHIWRLKIDMPFVEASDNGVKFVGNNAFGNNYVPVDQWSNPYGVCELNPAGRDVNIVRDEGGDFLFILNTLTGHYVMMKLND